MIGSVDDWDPQLCNLLARERIYILQSAVHEHSLNPAIYDGG
jgi:hypothetical protein